MSEQELNKCSFCQKPKPVMRKYIYAGNKDLDDNKQRVFVIIYYCQDCGIEEQEKPLLGLATTEMLLSEIKARLEISGLLKYRTVDDK